MAHPVLALLPIPCASGALESSSFYFAVRQSCFFLVHLPFQVTSAFRSYALLAPSLYALCRKIQLLVAMSMVGCEHPGYEI